MKLKLAALFLLGSTLVTPAFASEHDQLEKLIHRHWAALMTEYPEWATYVGYPGQNDRWTDLSRTAIEARRVETFQTLKKLGLITRSKLASTDQLNYDLFKYDLEDSIASDKFFGELLPVSQLDGVQQEAPQVLSIMPTTTEHDYENIISRLERLPVLVEQTIELMQEGIKKGYTAPKITLRNVPDQIQSILSGEDNPMLVAFKHFPISMPKEVQDRLSARALNTFKERVVPAMTKLKDFLTKTYIPACRETIALGALPNGQAWYSYKAKHHTTTSLNPKEIHEIGLAEVKRIRGEMNELIASLNFKGSFEDFSKFLREDSRFFFSKKEDLVTHYRDIAKRIDPKLPKLFGKLPRLTYGVEPVPSYSEISQTTAYYIPGALTTGRAGTFYANTYDLKMRPKWEMEALTLHEAVPGHHLQIALAQEMEKIPEFRKNGGYTAFVEGWGLYAESLGKELGMYEDPYSHYGQLTYEMWRAIRLVVDTGIHSMGWTRQQAIDFFKANSSKTDHDIAVEVDRYIVMPGQALAYKIGQLKIKELRDLASKKLGTKFDVRAFHDNLLKNGALPLDVLEAQMKKWISMPRPALTE